MGYTPNIKNELEEMAEPVRAYKKLPLPPIETEEGVRLIIYRCEFYNECPSLTEECIICEDETNPCDLREHLMRRGIGVRLTPSNPVVDSSLANQLKQKLFGQ